MKEYNLTRFLSAQEATVDGYSQALAEIRSGRKVHHWIWYIFRNCMDSARAPILCFTAFADLARQKPTCCIRY